MSYFYRLKVFHAFGYTVVRTNSAATKTRYRNTYGMLIAIWTKECLPRPILRSLKMNIGEMVTTAHNIGIRHFKWCSAINHSGRGNAYPI